MERRKLQNVRDTKYSRLKADCTSTVLNDMRRNINILSYGREHETKFVINL
jgi:hypothetical protein